jgi:hypothetical protein
MSEPIFCGHTTSEQDSRLLKTMAKCRFTCKIPGCERTRQPDQLMCRTHWYQVPQRLRQRVWAEFRHAAGSRAHLAACHEAIESVVRQQEVPEVPR